MVRYPGGNYRYRLQDWEDGVGSRSTSGHEHAGSWPVQHRDNVFGTQRNSCLVCERPVIEPMMAVNLEQEAQTKPTAAGILQTSKAHRSPPTCYINTPGHPASITQAWCLGKMKWIPGAESGGGGAKTAREYARLAR